MLNNYCFIMYYLLTYDSYYNYFISHKFIIMNKTLINYCFENIMRLKLGKKNTVENIDKRSTY